MLRHFTLSAASLLVFLTAISAGTAAGQSPLEIYVSEGLTASPGLRSASDTYQATQRQVDEARRAYLPSLELQARYTRAGGGRTIDFPIGDLLNPAYSALNGLTGSTAFPQLDNESFPLIRRREQDTRLQLIQPLYQPAISPGVRASEAAADQSDYALRAAKRDLASAIRDGYLQWLQAGAAVDIQRSALELVSEALRVVESLVENGMETGDAVYRTRAELARVEQDLASAETGRDLAAAAFNTLLNRPLNEPVVPMSVEALEADLGIGTSDLDAALSETAVAERSEMAQLDAAERLAMAQMDLAKGDYLPSVVLALDLGIQGGAYAVEPDESFRTASIVLNWKLFDGLRRGSRVERARLQQRAINAMEEDTANQIRLEVQQAAWMAQLEARNVEVARRRLVSAESAHRLSTRRYAEGMATVLDLLDSRTSLTAAELGLSLSRFSALRQRVRLLRATEQAP